MASPDLAPETTDAQQVLQRIFGYDSFRGSQQEIVEHVIGGGDALVLMPSRNHPAQTRALTATCAGATPMPATPMCSPRSARNARIRSEKGIR